jgi:T4-like virus Myoviridae tail sheath stabiliser
VSQYAPVPYDFEFTLYIYVKFIDDGLQIIEQIIPYFTPFYTITMDDIKPYDVKRDVAISLTSIVSEDLYQGDVAEDRVITWTLTFNAKGWVYPPINNASSIIKTADVRFFDMDNNQRLTDVTVQVDPLTANIDDDYIITTTITDSV